MVFGIDDSEILIAGRVHTILASIGVNKPSEVSDALSKLKSDFGLNDTDEVKWNGMKAVPQRKREELSQELMILLQESVPLITIVEGRDKQFAAEQLALQIKDCLRAQPYHLGASEAIEFVFDESILGSGSDYGAFLKASGSPLDTVSVTIVRSYENPYVQLADILAGFNRLATETALEKPNKQISVWDDAMADNIEIDLLTYISLSLRWQIWGSVPPPPNPENVTFDGTWPFKHIGGFGFRIHSTVSGELITNIYDSRVVYMGCLH